MRLFEMIYVNSLRVKDESVRNFVYPTGIGFQQCVICGINLPLL